MIEEGHLGYLAELDVINLLNSSSDFQTSFRLATKDLTSVMLKGKLLAINGKSGHKTDIEVIDEESNRIGISQKKAKRSARPDNHLDRRWVLESGRYSLAWAKALDMPDSISKILQDGILNKAKNSSANLINPSFNSAIESFLLSKLDVFLEQVFRKKEELLKLLAIQEYNGATELHLFCLDDIIALVKRNIEKRGINFRRTINLGDYLQIQRKAGNGVHVLLPKTDPNHPGNQMQTKLMVLRLKHDAISQGLKHRELSLRS